MMLLTVHNLNDFASALTQELEKAKLLSDRALCIGIIRNHLSEMKSAEPFEVGAVVVAKSGGPPMVVTDISGDSVHLSWFGKDGFSSETLPAPCLRLAPTKAERKPRKPRR